MAEFVPKKKNSNAIEELKEMFLTGIAIGLIMFDHSTSAYSCVFVADRNRLSCPWYMIDDVEGHTIDYLQSDVIKAIKELETDKYIVKQRKKIIFHYDPHKLYLYGGPIKNMRKSHCLVYFIEGAFEDEES